MSKEILIKGKEKALASNNDLEQGEVYLDLQEITPSGVTANDLNDLITSSDNSITKEVVDGKLDLKAVGGGGTSEVTPDSVLATLEAGANTTIEKNPTTNKITISSTGTNPTLQNTYPIIKQALIAGANTTITPNDANNTLTISSTGGGGGGTVDATSVLATLNGSNSNVTAAINATDQKIDLVYSTEQFLNALNAILKANPDQFELVKDDTAKTITLALKDAFFYEFIKNTLQGDEFIAITSDDVNQKITINFPKIESSDTNYFTVKNIYEIDESGNPTSKLAQIELGLSDSFKERIAEIYQKTNELHDWYNPFDEAKKLNLVERYENSSVDPSNPVQIQTGSEFVKVEATKTIYLQNGIAFTGNKGLPINKAKILAVQSDTRPTGYITGGSRPSYLEVANLQLLELVNELGVTVKPFESLSNLIVKIEVQKGKANKTKYTTAPSFAALPELDLSNDTTVLLTLDDGKIIELSSGLAWNGAKDGGQPKDALTGQGRTVNVAVSSYVGQGNTEYYYTTSLTIPSDAKRGLGIRNYFAGIDVVRNTQDFKIDIKYNNQIFKYVVKKTAQLPFGTTLAQIQANAANASNAGLFPNEQLPAVTEQPNLLVRRPVLNQHYIHKWVEVIDNGTEKILQLLPPAGFGGFAMESWDIFYLQQITSQDFGVLPSLPTDKYAFHALPVKLINGVTTDTRVIYMPSKKYIARYDSANKRMYAESVNINCSGKTIVIDGVTYKLQFNQGKNGHDVFFGASNGWVDKNDTNRYASTTTPLAVYENGVKNTVAVSAYTELDQNQQDAYSFVKFNEADLVDNPNAQSPVINFNPCVQTLVLKAENTVVSGVDFLTDGTAITPLGILGIDSGIALKYEKSQLEKEIIIENAVDTEIAQDNKFKAGVTQDGIEGKIITFDGRLLATGEQAITFNEFVKLRFNPKTNEFRIINIDNVRAPYTSVDTIKQYYVVSIPPLWVEGDIADNYVVNPWIKEYKFNIQRNTSGKPFVVILPDLSDPNALFDDGYYRQRIFNIVKNTGVFNEPEYLSLPDDTTRLSLFADADSIAISNSSNSNCDIVVKIQNSKKIIEGQNNEVDSYTIPPQGTTNFTWVYKPKKLNDTGIVFENALNTYIV